MQEFTTTIGAISATLDAILPNTDRQKRLEAAFPGELAPVSVEQIVQTSPIWGVPDALWVLGNIFGPPGAQVCAKLAGLF